MDNNIRKIVFRDEQKEAIDKTVECFKQNRKMLWNAKMRFGKTLCALEVAKRCDYHRTLIITHRPTVRSEWFEAIRKLGFKDWKFGCKKRILPNNQELDICDFKELEVQTYKNGNTHFVYFVSMQDMRGSRRVNAQNGTAKNEEIFSAHWDLLIIDEAHEGTFSKLGNEVMKEFEKCRSTHMLFLSGTPYNIQSMFDTQEVFHWDYIMEQKAKLSWNTKSENPYAGLARMNILTYNLSNGMKAYVKQGNLNCAELLRTEPCNAMPSTNDKKQTSINMSGARFVHDSDVRKFLSLIGPQSPSKNMPYACSRLHDSVDHTFWYVPSVAAAHCLSAILREDSPENPFREYTIVDVAGDGYRNDTRQDICEQTRFEKDALERVKSAIQSNNKTITISCGRLTMGVTVPEWTAVLILTDSSETNGIRYFQTIFRSQSPYKNGEVKENCYAIDFSPRRTLVVIDQYISNNLSDNNTDERIAKLTEFLNLCPVTKLYDAENLTYDTETFIRDINATYSDTLIRNGFRDDCLYGNLDNLKSQDIKLLDQVIDAIIRGTNSEKQRTREIIAKNSANKTKPTKSTQKSGVDIIQRTATDETLKILKRGTNKLTPRQRAIAILSQISTRFPMMIYGTVENVEGLTLTSFIQNIDADSWKEFMPKGITMKLFEKLKHFYREDIFAATAKAIVERLHKADELPIAERAREMADIISDFCYPDRETILTPWETVNRQMAGTIGGYCFFDKQYTKQISEPRFVYNGSVTEKTIMNPKAHVLDIASKTGLYSLYVAYSMYVVRSNQSQGLFDTLSDEESLALWEDIVKNNIFAVCRTKMAELITRRTLMGYHDTKKVNVYRLEDLIPQVIVYKHKFIGNIKKGKNFANPLKTNMEFDAIIGNPPYQVNIGESKENYGIPLYNHFVDCAREINPSYISMIIPSRWFTGGRGLDRFRSSMLSDRHIRAIYDFVDSKDCFPTVDISGGVNYFLWDKKHNGTCNFTNTIHNTSDSSERILDEFPIFVRNNRALKFINKVTGNNEAMLNVQVSGQTPFGFVTTFRGTTEPESETDIVLKSSGANSYIRRHDVKRNSQWIDSYKVIFSKATCEHAGTPDRNGMFKVLSSLSILPPGAVCTQSYLLGGAYDDEQTARNFKAYLQTRFVRYLMLQTITSQDLSPEKFAFVPIQDFTNNSDIAWTTSDIDNIDRQLYKKYGITDDEVGDVESIIKPI